MRRILLVGIINAALLATLCLIALNKKNSKTPNEPSTLASERQKGKSTDQTSDQDHYHPAKRNALGAITESHQTPDLQEQNTSDPLPLEWEDPVIAVLNNSYQNGDERNKALIIMALQTAKHVPRVQQECLMHLAYGLRDDDYESFLKLATDISIPVSVRLRFIDEVFSIRPKELTKWLGQSLRMTSDPALISRAQDFLKKQEETELFYKSQLEPHFQDTKTLPSQ